MNARRVEGPAPDADPDTTADPTTADTLKVAMYGRVASVTVTETAAGRVGVRLVLDQHLAQHPQAVQAMGVWMVPDQGSYAADIDLARRTRAALLDGTLALILGHGIETGHWQGQPVFRVISVLGLQRLEGVPVPAGLAATEPAPVADLFSNLSEVNT